MKTCFLAVSLSIAQIILYALGYRNNIPMFAVLAAFITSLSSVYAAKYLIGEDESEPLKNNRRDR